MEARQEEAIRPPAGLVPALAALGLLAALAGVLALVDLPPALAPLAFLLAAVFFVRGAFQLAWRARGREGGWARALVEGIASILLAVAVWAAWSASGG